MGTVDAMSAERAAEQLTEPERVLLLTVAGDIHLKSPRTRKRFERILVENLEAALAWQAPGARVKKGGLGRIVVHCGAHDLAAAATAARSVFGIYRVVPADVQPISSFDDLVDAMTAKGQPLVDGQTFAVRCRRRGSHAWSSHDVEVEVGNRLIANSAGVNLSRPDVTVRAEVYDDVAYLLDPPQKGSDGLPLRTQPTVLSMLSGGFDSPVAAWMLMRRGCPVDFVHFTMDCAQSEHAIAVAYELWRRWGAGTKSTVRVVDFSGIKEALLEHVEDRHRQVALKQLMFRVAERVARAHRYPAVVTGEAIGQVSTQTLHNLVEIDRVHAMTVFRPLAGLSKEEIIERSREIGTHDLSARAKEVCNLAVGRVETAARRDRLARAMQTLPADLVEVALGAQTAGDLRYWEPGMQLAPVVAQAPAGATVLSTAPAQGAPSLPPRGTPIAVTGPRAITQATRLMARGHDAMIVDATEAKPPSA